MPYDPMSSPQFNDPDLRQQLADDNPQAARQGFDARALFQLLRRRGLGRLGYADLNNNAFDTGGHGYDMDDQGYLTSQGNSNLRMDPTDRQGMDSLYDLEDTHGFKQSSFSGHGPQSSPASDLDKLNFMAEGRESMPQMYGEHYDPYHMSLDEPDPSQMARHAVKKQGY